MGGTTAIFGLLGGVWFPIPADSALHYIAGAAVLLARPGEPRRHRRGRLGHHRLGRDGDLDRRLTRVAIRAYRRDTQRPSL